MNYKEIIQDNCKNHSDVSWWPKFAYHYTDVTNAVKILSTKHLYSRTKVTKLGIMSNDNASKQVIDMTQTEALSCVRFYFRPLTPTQYYNEGFKHPSLRYQGDINANVPVPIFFLFDLEKLLSNPCVKFSEKPQSGYGSKLVSGIDAFSKLKFNYIYKNGYVDNYTEVNKFRHAEILYPNSMAIDESLHSILCRNNVDRLTLLNLLKAENPREYRNYLDKIKVCKYDMFENNGLYVTDCQYNDGLLTFTLSDSYAKKNYQNNEKYKNKIKNLEPISVKLKLEWCTNRSLVYQSSVENSINYETMKTLQYRLQTMPNNATILKIKLYFENSLVCYSEKSLKSSDLIK